MANLSGQNIGTNYKGILNLNTLNGNLSGTLQAVTDGDGNASPLQLSTTQVTVIGDSSGSIPAIFKMIPNTSVPTYGAFFTANYDNNQWLTIGKGSSGYLTFGDDKVYSEKSWGFGIASGTLSARLHVRGAASTNAALFETSAIGEIATIGVGGGNTSRFNGAIRADFINDYANGYTLLQYVSATQIRVGNDALRLNPTTLEAIFNGAIRAASLPTTRPATVGDLYVDTAANILANGDKVVGIRV
jgi:hypothetical protein